MSTAVALLEDPVQDYGYLALLERVKYALAHTSEISVPVDQIRRYPSQPRKHFDEASIKRLSVSIQRGGQAMPGLIRIHPEGDAMYELIDGERRWRAIRLILENERPLYNAKLIVADDEVVRYLISGVANFNREGHTPLESMDTIMRMRDEFKIPMQEVADLLGISLQWAYSMHGLQNLLPSVSKMLEPGLPKAMRLPLTAAVQISKADRKVQVALANRIIDKSLTLGRLRTEVIKISHAAGVPVRTREIEPRKRWALFTRKVASLQRQAAEIEATLKDAEYRTLVKGRVGDYSIVKSQLKATRDCLFRCEDLAEKSKP